MTPTTLRVLTTLRRRRALSRRGGRFAVPDPTTLVVVAENLSRERPGLEDILWEVEAMRVAAGVARP